MKLTILLPFVAVTTAFVLPQDEAMAQAIVESKEASKSFLDSIPGKDGLFSHVEETFKNGVAYSENAIDTAMSAAFDLGKKAKSTFQCHKSMMAFDVEEWLDTASDSLEEFDLEHADHPHRHPHHKKPHHHHKPKLTVYELINSSKYTTKLAKLINEYDDLVALLNGTTSNFTIFAPTDKAFAKIPHHGDKKPSKDLILKVLSYHVSPDFYPAGRVLASHTIPTALDGEGLGKQPQRLRVGLSLKGLTINFYSRVVAANIFGTNGVIHGVDSIILPPPPALKIISLLPGEFSTLQLALTKTGLGEALAQSSYTGGTLFAPTNFAFKKLGPRINAFLFSKYGEKYLKALLKYHIVANQTLYSDAFYPAADAASKDVDSATIPKGVFHVDLPTLLTSKSLSIDVARYGALINIRINGYTDVAVADGIAKDGVIHIPRSVLIPPKAPGGAAYMGEELSLEDFKERFGDLVDEEEKQEEQKSTSWFEL
jgi:uncharacterized surface protein with fasciclin (FAS1) repeats